ncbi:hypothetical protein [Actinokineospora cianjurensis]|uniref:Uncharacterized protein n=1 Tax=Actinokineospora cianjurensis TaxID=585224 RepID=A0A421B3V3_9PSEU|nr:hypothetical protein [Actinokineospora cianjurensis]RLK58970.1 hypothetical protein CLV68_3451 [Actinokineospora cianjurensis]
MSVRKDLERDWCLPGERLLLGISPKGLDIGSRVGDQVRVPHPPAPGGPEPVPIAIDYPTLSVHAPDLQGDDWIEEPGLGWWAEAEQDGDDAVVAADHLAACSGQASIAITDRRFAVVFPDRLLAATRARLAAETREKSVLKRVTSALDDWTKQDKWVFRDVVVSLWEVDRGRVARWWKATAGRSVPFHTVVRVEFGDGSILSTPWVPHTFIRDS